MYMLVNEDRTVPTVGERIPPWGAATAEQYLERVKRNLDSLERSPKLTLNYEWAAHSLDDIANRFPVVMKRMQAAHQRRPTRLRGRGVLTGSYADLRFGKQLAAVRGRPQSLPPAVQ